MANTDPADNAATSTEKPAGQSRLKSIMLIVVSSLLLGETTFIGLQFGTKLLGDSSENAQASTLEGTDGTVEVKTAVAGILPLEAFLVNLADSDASRYMRLTLKLGFGTASEVSKAQDNEIKMAKIRDAVLGVLTRTTSVEILSLEGKLNMRQQIIDQVNGVLGGGKVVEVYFQELVVQ